MSGVLFLGAKTGGVDRLVIRIEATDLSDIGLGLAESFTMGGHLLTIRHQISKAFDSGRTEQPPERGHQAPAAYPLIIGDTDCNIQTIHNVKDKAASRIRLRIAGQSILNFWRA